jgi:hypothetical protein
MSSKRLVIVAFDVPLEKQNEVLTCFRYYLEGKIGFAEPVAFAAGRPERAFYSLFSQLEDSKYLAPKDLIDTLLLDVSQFYGILQKLDFKRNEKREIEVVGKNGK